MNLITHEQNGFRKDRSCLPCHENKFKRIPFSFAIHFRAIENMKYSDDL